MKHSWSVSGVAVMAAAFTMVLPANALDLGVSVGPVSVDASVGSDTSVSVGVGSDTSVGVSVGGGDGGGSSPPPSEPSAPSTPSEPSSPGTPSSPSSPEQPSAPGFPQFPSENGGGGTSAASPQVPRQGSEQAVATPRGEVRTQTSVAPAKTVPKRASRPAKPRIDPTRALDGSRRVWAHGSESGKLEALLDLVAGCSLQDVDLRRSVNDRRISIIPLDRSFGGDALLQLRTALGSPSQGRSEAVVAVRESSMLSNVLMRAGYSPDQVVALQVARNGGADIFVFEDEEPDPGYPFSYASGPARTSLMPVVERDLCDDPPPIVHAEIEATRREPAVAPVPKTVSTSPTERVTASDATPSGMGDLLVATEDADELVALLDRTQRLDRLLMALNGPPTEEGNPSPAIIDDIVNTSHERVRVAALPGGRNLLIAAGVEPPLPPSTQSAATAEPDTMVAATPVDDDAGSTQRPWSSVSPYLTSLASAPETSMEPEETTRVAELPPVPDMLPPDDWGEEEVDRTTTGSILPGDGGPDPLPPAPTRMAALPDARKETDVDLDLPESLSPEANAIIEEACREFAADLAEGSKDFDVQRAAAADEVEIIAVPGCAPSQEVRAAFQSIFDDQPRIVAELAASGHGLDDVIGGSNNSAGVAIYVMEPVTESNR